MRITRCVLALAATVLAACSLLRPPEPPDEVARPIRLNARVFAPDPGIGRALEKRLTDRPMDGRVLLLIQFEEPPGPAVRRFLVAREVTLLDPIPDRAYLASAPGDVGLVRGLVEHPYIRWVGAVRPDDKIAPELQQGELPGHARRPDGRADAIVQFRGDVGAAEQRSVLEARGIEAVSRIRPLNAWRVFLAGAEVAGLAALDEVKWIALVPPPGEPDNDGVRSATGVGSDLVVTPAPYELTGEGVLVGVWDLKRVSIGHPDFAGRVTIGDGPVPPDERMPRYVKATVSAAWYAWGDEIYHDFDDDKTVSVGDYRSTVVGSYDAGSYVEAGDTDVGGELRAFQGGNYHFVDNVVEDEIFTAGEGIYHHVFGDFVVPGDERLTPVDTYDPGSIVGAGDSDAGRSLLSLTRIPHQHPTHVVGTLIGDGTRSQALGGEDLQWRGVAPGAHVRGYSAHDLFNELAYEEDYLEAMTQGVDLSSNSWGRGFYDEAGAFFEGYSVLNEYYDALISGRRSDGMPCDLTPRILVIGSAGNSGTAEMHTENVAADGAFEQGETIYLDLDGDLVVSAADRLLLGSPQPAGSPLVVFAHEERYTSVFFISGGVHPGDRAYRDVDGSRTVSVGDVRLVGFGAYAAGSAVEDGDSDEGAWLWAFNFWGNHRVSNGAKDTLAVANLNSDTSTLHPSSARGPTHDGRTKPDVAGPGCEAGFIAGIRSTLPPDRYGGMGGTSQSTPAVSGVAALLIQWYGDVYEPEPLFPDLLRATVVHSCEDVLEISPYGSFPGPDFASGYGRVRAKEAADVMPHHVRGSVPHKDSGIHEFTIGAVTNLKVTLVWDDPAWSPLADASDETGLLQNDLDLTVIAPDGRAFHPWVLDGERPSIPASRGSWMPGEGKPPRSDRRNTVEQVLVDEAQAGTWTIEVRPNQLNLPPQDYAVICEHLPPAHTPGTHEMFADLWLQDNAQDTGAEPSEGDATHSPDVWVRNAADGGTEHEPAVAGAVNYVYVRVRSRTIVRIPISSVDVWSAAAGPDPIWPDDFSFVGRVSVPRMTPWETRVLGPIPWTPPTTSPDATACLYVRAAAPLDIVRFDEGESVWTNTAECNNLAGRMVDLVDGD